MKLGFRPLLLKACLCCFLLAPTLAGAQQEPAVTAKVDRSRITVGDLIRYTVTVSAEDGIQVDLPSGNGRDRRFRGQELSGHGTCSEGREERLDSRVLSFHLLDGGVHDTLSRIDLSQRK